MYFIEFNANFFKKDVKFIMQLYNLKLNDFLKNIIFVWHDMIKLQKRLHTKKQKVY